MVVGASPESTPDQKENAKLRIKVMDKNLKDETKRLDEIEERSRIKRQRVDEEAALNESLNELLSLVPDSEFHPDLPQMPSVPGTTQQITDNGTVVAKPRRGTSFANNTSTNKSLLLYLSRFFSK